MAYIDPKVWARTWREAAPRLEAVRRDEIRRTDHVAIAELFDGVFEYALQHRPLKPTSGLIEQQRIFAKGARPG